MLPRELVLDQPALLAVALNQAMRWNQLQRRDQSARVALRESRRQVEHLASLLWGTTPADDRKRWLTQRQFTDRLQEEVSRSQRHGTPLTLAIGEIHMGKHEEFSQANLPQLAAWTMEHICKAKRLSDVAGQYGPDRFALLLVHTAEVWRHQVL